MEELCKNIAFLGNKLCCYWGGSDSIQRGDLKKTLEESDNFLGTANDTQCIPGEQCSVIVLYQTILMFCAVTIVLLQL